MSVYQSYCVLRPARTMDEIKTLFHLRYQGYLNSDCAALVRQNPLGFEIDEYDPYAQHLGLFQVVGKKQVAIGYMRQVQATKTDYAPMIQELANAYPGAATRLHLEVQHELPLLACCQNIAEVEHFYQVMTARGARFAEASRFVFAPHIRAAGYARFVVEGSAAFVFDHYGYDYSIIACHPHHAPFYESYGFFKLLDGNANDYNGLKASILVLDNKDLSGEKGERIRQMGRVCQNMNELYLLPNQKNIFYPEQVIAA
ncbi:MAG TPA: hypothetical protein PKA00_02305 [Saprospiraceae bacterium]|nr:hypothetical protein [Saprospiraceae bacterium]HMQ81704.1 hypothetical protein [Saprospiraceae bacterium]